MCGEGDVEWQEVWLHLFLIMVHPLEVLSCELQSPSLHYTDQNNFSLPQRSYSCSTSQEMSMIQHDKEIVVFGGM